jgi:hypothetical protein
MEGERMNQLVLDLTAARAERDKGLARTGAKNAEWLAQALEDLRAFATHREQFTLEQFRVEAALLRRPEPSSHHAWGALAQAAQAALVVEWTGRYVPAASKKTHAHPVKLWRSLVYKRAA